MTATMPEALPRRRPLTPALLGAFFVFATAMCAAAAASLAWPESALSLLWQIKPAEFARLRQLGAMVPIGFAALAVVMAVASAGAFARRRWGWGLAVAIFLCNGIADAARVFSAPLEGAIGVACATAILWWLSRPQVRAMFGQ